MLNLVLYQPQIPANTGNLIRLAANTSCAMHLIPPFGFVWQDKRLLRAGLDYHEFANIALHSSLDSYLETVPGRIIVVETFGTVRYDQFAFAAGDSIMLGAETFGVPQEIVKKINPAAVVFIPQTSHTRSLNLSNAAAIVLYEGLRQLGFPGVEIV